MFIVIHRKENEEWKLGNVIHENSAWAMDEQQHHIYNGEQAEIYQLRKYT